MLDEVLTAYGFHGDTQITPHGSGLINRTWLIGAPKGKFILQQINNEVFSTPSFIAENIERVSDWLTTHYPGSVFPKPVTATIGGSLVERNGQSFRLYPFIENSVTIDVADTPSQAYEAAKKFGEFTRMLSLFPADTLHQTLPGFHDLSSRYKNFQLALEKGNQKRLQNASRLIGYLVSQSNIVTEYETICSNPEFRLRVTHHDTKISNVLFDKQGKGICVIDLDTMMPGYFISDVGDMLRTYLSPVSEEEKDVSRIIVRESYFQAIVEGYMEEMREELTETEKNAFVYAGEFMMDMQSLRFLTDYLNDDVYYGRKYEDHNYVRALNQAALLLQYQEKSSLLRQITRDIAGTSSAARSE